MGNGMIKCRDLVRKEFVDPVAIGLIADWLRGEWYKAAAMAQRE